MIYNIPPPANPIAIIKAPTLRGTGVTLQVQDSCYKCYSTGSSPAAIRVTFGAAIIMAARLAMRFTARVTFCDYKKI